MVVAIFVLVMIYMISFGVILYNVKQRNKTKYQLRLAEHKEIHSNGSPKLRRANKIGLRLIKGSKK